MNAFSASVRLNSYIIHVTGRKYIIFLPHLLHYTQLVSVNVLRNHFSRYNYMHQEVFQIQIRHLCKQLELVRKAK